jgi:hypothetical protein
MQHHKSQNTASLTPGKRKEKKRKEKLQKKKEKGQRRTGCIEDEECLDTTFP